MSGLSSSICPSSNFPDNSLSSPLSSSLSDLPRASLDNLLSNSLSNLLGNSLSDFYYICFKVRARFLVVWFSYMLHL
jgi:hypothetical protein